MPVILNWQVFTGMLIWCLVGVHYSQVKVWSMCESVRRSLQIRINFEISFESKVDTSVVTSLNFLASSGQLGTDFAMEAFKRNEIVEATVAVSEVFCSTCAGTNTAVNEPGVAQSTVAIIGSLQTLLLIALLGLWAFTCYDIYSKPSAQEHNQTDCVQLFMPAAQNDSKDKVETYNDPEVAQTVSSGACIEVSRAVGGIESLQADTLSDSCHHAIEIVHAAAMHCG